MTRVVAVGGGTGMPILIKGLLEIGIDIQAVVTVADDGGSSGVLRQELGIMPPGDSRNCLVAMANGNTLMSSLFQYRFESGEGLKSHAVGNLIIAALTDISGDFSKALVLAGSLLGARGRVMPSSLEPLTLLAQVETWSSSNGGGQITGQCNIANRLRPLKSIAIEPKNTPGCPEALRALGSAEVIILGPGSLFTSILPNLLIKDINETIKQSSARKIYLSNITIQPGETSGFTAADHIHALLDNAGPRVCDEVITSNTIISREGLAELDEAKTSPLIVDDQKIRDLGVKHTTADLTDERFATHHDPHKLAAFFRGAI